MYSLKYAIFFLCAAGLFFPARQSAAQSVPTNPSASSPSTTEEDESNVSERKWAREIESDLVAEKFDELDRMADQYRSEKSRFPGGSWKLTHFYGVLDKPHLTDQDSLDHLAHLKHWVEQRPESITARVALATSLHRWAWVARGNGTANTVSDTGWRLFNERISQSYSVLQDAAKLPARCPGWYSEMMVVGLAQGWDEKQMKEIFEQAVQFEPDYFRFYKEYANYLLPKWHGKPGDATAFAKTSADNVGGDEGDQIYFHIATAVVGKNGSEFATKEMDWARIQRGYQALTAQYGTTGWLKNEIAYLAYKFRDAAFAKQQFEVIGDHWNSGVWRDRERFDRARDWSRRHS
ncbi:MAG: DUF4034 domain-containing protein [Terracidiphilus sp.]|jgi:hypothetical protein